MVSVVRRRAVEVAVSDRAVLRWLERSQGLDVGAIRRLIAGKVTNAAELGAVAVQIEKVRFVLRDSERMEEPRHVVVTTVLKLDQRRGLGCNDPGGGGDA